MKHGRPATLRASRVSLAVVQAEGEGLPTKYPRPHTYGDCMAMGLGTALPCPYVGCKYSLRIDVNPCNGSITLRETTTETCTLVVAERGGILPGEVGALIGIIRNAVDMVEAKAIDKLSRNALVRAWGASVRCGEAAEYDDASGSRTEGDALDALVSAQVAELWTV